MKIVAPTSEARRQIKHLRDAHADIIADFSRKHGEFSRLDKRRQLLSEEIERLERDADPDDAQAIRRLSECEVEHRLLVKRVERLGDAESPPIDDLRGLLREAGQVFPRALKPTWENYVREICNAIRPFYASEAAASLAARASDAAVQLGLAIQWPHAASQPSIGLAEAIVKRADEILSGRFEWELISSKSS